MAGRPGDDDGALKRLREVFKRLRDAGPLLDTDESAFNAAVEDLARRLGEVTGIAGEIELHISTNRISYGDDEVFKSEARSNNVAFDMFRQGLRRLTFKPGVSGDEVHAFVVAFAENRSADQVDEDFISTLWQESLPNIAYIAIDGFTEKIFMSEQRFLGAFRGVIDDVMPGLLEMPDDDPGDDQARTLSGVDDAAAADQADLEQRKLRKALPQVTPSAIGEVRREASLEVALDQAMRLLGRVAIKQPSPLADDALRQVIVRALSAYLEDGLWRAFADAVRSLRQIVEGGERLGLEPERISTIRQAIAGRGAVEQLAHHLDPAETDFTAWARWHFATAQALSAPDLLELIDACQSPAGVQFLKDLLRRQGTESLDPWAERLRDPNPGVVLEVIEVIVGSDLCEQARPLLIETMKHPAPEVRAAAAEGLAGAYDLAAREALLPFLKDPSTMVRQAVVTRFLAAGDKSVAPYLASTIKSDIFPGFDEDEQRLYFETLARLGGARFLSVFEGALGLDDERSTGALGRLFKRGHSALIDTPTRRGAVSGLGVLGSREALALIRRAHARADLGLAAHCDVVLRLAARGQARGEAPADLAPPKARALEDVEVGRTRTGDRVLFTLDSLSRPAPDRVVPEGAPREAPPAAPPPAPAVEASLATDADEGPAPASDRAERPSLPAGPPPLDLGDRPLLRLDERYLATDVTPLEVVGGTLGEGSLTLSGITLSIGGRPSPTARRSLPRPATPSRRGRTGGLPQVVERRRRAPRHIDFSEETAAPAAPVGSVDDILRSYLGADATPPPPPAPPEPPVPANALLPSGPPAGVPPPGPDSQDAMRRLLDFDAPTHHEVKAITVPPPTDVVVTEPSLRPAGDPSMVAPDQGEAGLASVEALLKDFLALPVEEPSELTPSVEPQAPVVESEAPVAVEPIQPGLAGATEEASGPTPSSESSPPRSTGASGGGSLLRPPESGAAARPTPPEPAGESSAPDPPPAPIAAAQSDPAQSDPAQSDPAQSDPAQSDPAQSDPAQSDPAQSDPAPAPPAPTQPQRAQRRRDPFAGLGRRRSSSVTRPPSVGRSARRRADSAGPAAAPPPRPTRARPERGRPSSAAPRPRPEPPGSRASRSRPANAAPTSPQPPIAPPPPSSLSRPSSSKLASPAPIAPPPLPPPPDAAAPGPAIAPPAPPAAPSPPAAAAAPSPPAVAPSAAPSAPEAPKGEGVDDLLKQFLDLDLEG